MTPPKPIPSQPLLSFCIPSYNRLIRVRELVLSLLSLPEPDIEVIVLDNGSTDGTFDELKQITDPRFKLTANPENRGALFNMVNVFGYASGEYVVYSTDQDRTNVERLNEFKAFLRSYPGVSCGFCEFDMPGGQRHKIFSRGYEAVNAIAYKGRHPTGYFFRNDHLRTVRLAERMADFNVVDLFPLEFALGEVALIGDGAIYDGGLFSPNNGDDVVEHKSATTNGASKNAFFAPATRLKLAVSYSRHVEQLPLSQGEKSQLLAQIFFAELRAATVGYRNVMANERLCIHYRTEPRKIGGMEMIRIGVNFTQGYFAQRFGRANRSALAFTGNMLSHLSRKLAGRLSRV